MSLKRCPFCGGAGHIVTSEKGAWVQCVTCEARGGVIMSYRPESATGFREEVRDRWNMRRDTKVSSRISEPWYPGFGTKAERLKKANQLRRKLTQWNVKDAK